MQQVLDDQGMDGRDLRDLMSKRRRVVSGQTVPTAPAPIGPEGHNPVDLFYRDKFIGAAVVSGLATRGASRRWLRIARRCKGGITRRRARRIPGVLVEPSLQFLILSFERLELFEEL
jgi:hypothetical protein